MSFKKAFTVWIFCTGLFEGGGIGGGRGGNFGGRGGAIGAEIARGVLKGWEGRGGWSGVRSG